MIRIKSNDKPHLPHCEMLVDGKLHKKLDRYDLTSFLNCHATTLLIGKPKSGKTSLLHSMFEHSHLLRYCYTKVYLFQPIQSGASIKNNIFDLIPKEQVYRELTFENLHDVKTQLEQDSADKINSCIIIDDMTAELKNKSTLKLFKQIVYNRRHFHVSMYFLCQTWFSVPKDLRRLWSNIFVFKVSKNEMKNIWDEIIEHADDFMHPVMKIIYNEPFKFMFVNTDSQRIFNGWDELLLEED